MHIIRTAHEMQALRRAMHGRVGAVYTMGALHEGHLALVAAARHAHDHVIASIFVNPTQFAAGEDFDKYPRDEQRDLELFAAAGVEAVFMPSPAEVYPTGFQTTIRLSGVTQGLEGARRPGHFDGVATVVAKLFNATSPHAAFFGQKDAQQVAVVRRMARDLNFPVDIVVVPTLRESDGLAMSSRNRYLTPAQRAAAAVVPRAMRAAVAAYGAGERETARLLELVRREISAEPLASLDYVSLNDPSTLLPSLDRLDGPALLSLTVQVGATHLLDNCLLPDSLNTQDGLTAVLGA
ncbi:MAG: pantoate--beta-alanine ligase [Pleurocapsa minor GSE-CHR-MK-17-07R]|jgi:pantoate--beta-alanine ligase|nr:pantoate--beta-alanine ligase [Pleurocapsa minor GSE-CHR-MK 17-07R]